ncbi:MAG: DUF4384 domain-containing protein [Methylococcales bacterium]
MRHITKNLVLFLLIILLTACSLSPYNADIGTDETLPEVKSTIYEKAISQYGLMQTIFDVRRDTKGRDDKQDYTLRVMVENIADNTGTSGATQFEIPQDVTKMAQSTLNAIGGRILYIPFDAPLMANLQNLGYSAFEQKKVPDVIISGGITEFDRGLVTKGDTSDAGIDVGKSGGGQFEDQIKASLASITLDFNLLDFKTMTGIPKMQAINSVKVHKATREDSIGFTIKSATFGAKGEIKRVQGRHAAVRLIVQLSMLQILGRYQKLPYWTLLPGVEPDQVVIEQVRNDFERMTLSERLAKAQLYLYLQGYALSITQQMDIPTQNALIAFANKYNLPSTNGLSWDMYFKLFESVPINRETLQRRNNVTRMAEQQEPMNIPIAQFEQPAPVNNDVSSKPFTVKDTHPLNVTLTAFKKHYQVNDVLTFQAQVFEQAHVHCFFKNYQGQLWRIFPNQFQTNDLLAANSPIRIPAQNPAFEITLDTAHVTEQVMCLAARGTLTSAFPELLGDTQSPLPFDSLTQLIENYQNNSKEPLYQQTLSIQVN